MIIGSGPGPEPPGVAWRAVARPTVGSVVAGVFGDDVGVSGHGVDLEVVEDVVVDDVVGAHSLRPREQSLAR